MLFRSFRKLLDEAQAGDNVGVLLRGIQRTEIERDVYKRQEIDLESQSKELKEELKTSSGQKKIRVKIGRAHV